MERETLRSARKAALEVCFITTKEELQSYTSAIYYAMMWGEKEKEKAVQNKSQFLKDVKFLK